LPSLSHLFLVLITLGKQTAKVLLIKTIFGPWQKLTTPPYQVKEGKTKQKQQQQQQINVKPKISTSEVRIPHDNVNWGSASVPSWMGYPHMYTA